MNDEPIKYSTCYLRELTLSYAPTAAPSTSTTMVVGSAPTPRHRGEWIDMVEIGAIALSTTYGRRPRCG